MPVALNPMKLIALHSSRFTSDDLPRKLRGRLFTLHSSLFTVSLALLAGCSKTGGGAAPTLADVALPVRTLAATNAVFERSVSVQGSLESVDSAVVSARIPGPLLRVCVDVGDEAKAGETVLFEVDPATVSNQEIGRAHV